MASSRLLLFSALVGLAASSPIAPLESGCTTTLVPDYNIVCSWDGTSTQYPSTTTVTQEINCNGCSNVSLVWGHCPNQEIKGSTSVKTPFTETVTACDTSTLQASPAQAAVAAVITPDGGGGNPMVASPQTSAGILLVPRETGTPNGVKRADLAACPTTIVSMPDQQAGKTKTTYSRYTTKTVKVNCGGCPLVVTTALVAYGPPTVFDKTTTLPVGAKTAYACS